MRFARWIAQSAALIGCLVVANGASATIITFDVDATGAPILAGIFPFSETFLNLDAFSSFGITWLPVGGGATISDPDELGWSLSGQSPPNVLTYWSFGFYTSVPYVTDAVIFSTPQDQVSFKAARPFPSDVMTVDAFNASDVLVDEKIVHLNSEFQEITLSGGGITRVTYTAPEGYAIDDISFAGPDIPTRSVSEPFTLATFLIGLFCASRRQRIWQSR